jgi:tRNA(fMet)-specific endonuclease VapC
MRPKRYLLDTNICVFFLRQKYDIGKKLSEVGLNNCFISEITIAELLYGAECSSNPDQNTELVNQFCENMNVIPISNCLSEYSKQKAILRRSRKPIEDLDLFIGATAVANNMILVTDNVKHLSRLAHIKIENWILRDI